MIVSLAGRALTLDANAGRLADPALWDDARRLWLDAPTGGGVELRAGLVLFALAAAELRGAVARLAPGVDFDPIPLGSRLAGVLADLGMAPREALAALLRLLAPAPVAAPTPEPAAAPVATEAPLQDDPYPGMTRGGETWPVYNRRAGGDTAIKVQNEREEWRAAGLAYEGARAAEWMAAVGERLGFVWVSPGEG